MTGYLHRLGISVIPYLDDWLIHHPDHQVLLRHQAQLINTLDLVSFILNRKKSELDLVQDLQFLGIRLRLDLGEASLPESFRVPPSTNLPSSVPAYGITQLGLRSYPSGSFAPETPSTSLFRSDRLHDFYGRFLAGVGRSHGGFPVLGYLETYRPQAPYRLSGAQGSSLCPKALGSSAPGPLGYDRYGQFDSSFVYQQARRDPHPFSHLVTFDSRASPLVRGSGHNSPSKAYYRLSERDSRPPISSQSANIDRVVPPPRDREMYLQALGDTRSRHVCEGVELPPSSVHVSSSRATSPSGGCSVSGLAGEVNVHVSSIQSAQQSHSEAPVHPGGRSNSRSPLVAETVVVSTPRGFIISRQAAILSICSHTFCRL